MPPTCEFAQCPITKELPEIDPSGNSTEIIDVSSWNTYRNAKYGLELRYPPSWKKGNERDSQEELNVKDVNEETFEEYLYMKDKPDMIIRTSGEKRTSGFLLWQGEFSEWFFVDKYWPEFEKEDFLKCVDEFSKRDRRFGK